MATTRSAVIRAVRYTLMTANTDLDELLKYTFMEYLLLMEDSDLEIRKLALSTLCSAIRNKPFLIMENLLDLTPLLLAKTLVREDLIHTVQMGPFKHVVDEGLELRKVSRSLLIEILKPSRLPLKLCTLYQIHLFPNLT